MKIMFIGDIVGQPGREIVSLKLPELRAAENPDIIIANAENAAGGKGLTGQTAHELFDYGIDVLTLGNHTFDRKEIDSVIDDQRVLRPANYPPNVPGQGYGMFTVEGRSVGVISLMGRVYMPLTDCPFRKSNEIIEKIWPTTKIIFVDFHAEVTSEKQAIGWYLDGRVSAVAGTHTHIQTADERILQGGTAYITDAGMTGPSGGVIGMDRDIVIKRFLTALPQQFIVAKGKRMIQGCVIEVDEDTGKAAKIKRLSIQE